MRTERVFVMMFIISLGMRLLHIDGSGPMLVCTLSGLSVMYFFFAFYFFSVDGIRGPSLLMSIIAGILLSLAPVGILFRLMYWEHGKSQVMFGAMFSLITLIVVLIMKYTSETRLLVQYYRNMVARSLVLFVVSFLVFMPAKKTLVSIEWWDDPQMAKLKTQYLAHPDDAQYRKAYEVYMAQKKK